MPHSSGGKRLTRECRRGPLVPRGEETPYQLPRVVSGNASSEDIPETTSKQASAATTVQSDSGSVHKQSGWDSLCVGNDPSKNAMDVVPRERYPPNSAASPREGEHQSRYRVESDEGSLRLDAEPINLQTGIRSLPVPRGRFVCNMTDLPTATILQLEARPTSGSDGCLPPRLEKRQGLCQSSLEPYGRVLLKVEELEAEAILIAPIWPSQPWYLL